MLKSEIFKKIKNIVNKTVMMLLCTVLLLCIMSIAIYNKICFLGYAYGTVVSESMLPEYKVGCLVLIDYSEKPKVGEVGVYFNGKMVIHRVTSIKDGYYRFKGDNNSVEDLESVPEKLVWGKVIKHTNYFADISEKYDWNVPEMVEDIRILALFILVVILGISFYYDIKSNYKHNNSDNDDSNS